MPGPDLLFVVLAGVMGLLIGSFLNVVAYRVPAGISLLRESRCPNCDASVKPWQNVPIFSWLVLRGRCAACRRAISIRYPLVEAFTGVVFAGITWICINAYFPIDRSGEAFSFFLLLAAYLYFASISIVLALIDLDTHRLPNVIVLPAYLVAGVILTLACLFGGDWEQLIRAGAGMVVMYAFYFTIRLVRPDGMGGGDVKLAGVVGIYLGWIGWGALAVGAFAAFLLGGLFGLALVALRRAGRKSALPFGPWLLAGAWVGIVSGESLGRIYVGLYQAH
jgi:leader peptidase (prepilin peptidase)/N-methyltransferase